ncbi:hypothetical protein [Melittangium boletus]|uniref:hypothetical protein n=1 Tax=Melittangium boletus TaxID=83453 RepID=UPI0012FD544B|nr:hypothetical protein [Melittangium boletus]
MPQQDLNALHHNHPIFDLRDHRGGLNSVKTSVRAANTRGDPFETYLRGLRDVMGARPGTWAAARTALYPQLPPATGEALMLRQGYVSVNEEHVEPFRESLRNPENYRKASYRELADRVLKHEPVRIAGTVYRRYQALEDTRRGSSTPVAVRQQVEAALRALREGLACRVRSNGITTRHLVNLESFRNHVSSMNPHMTPAEIKSWVFPELLMVARHGGGVRGNAIASGLAGGRGAAGGAVVSVLFEAGHLKYEGETLQLPLLGKAAVAGGTSGIVGGVAQNLVMANAGQSASKNLIGHGLNSRLATGAGRGLGGVVAGGLAAPVFTTTALALDDEEHSRVDYLATGTRAFVSGGLSSALAAGVVGAIWGSEVPLLGNAVGFIIGFAGYYVVDALTGEIVEDHVRRGVEGSTDGGR